MAGPLLFAALPFGYGPAAKVLALAAALRRRGIAVSFAGSGIALELVARQPDDFAALVDVAAGAERASALVAGAAAVVSVMDRDLAALACARGTPLFVVDSLLWLRDAVPPALRGARRYWAQRFGDQPLPPGLAAVPLQPVGPIVTPRRRRRTAGAGLLVNLGGADSLLDPDGTLPYAELVLRHLLASDLGRAFAGRIAVTGGRGAIDRIRRGFAGAGLRAASLAHDDAVRAFAAAELVLTAPGLTATLECFQLGVPTLFLPPQSYSQWCILRTLRAAGLAPHAFHWEDLWPGPPIATGMPEAVRNPLVRAALAALCADARAGEALEAALSAAAGGDRGALAAAQRRFFERLGENGVEQIARALAAELGGGREERT